MKSSRRQKRFLSPLKVQEVDVGDFVDPENGEIINDLGLEALIRAAFAAASAGWHFQSIERDQTYPYIFRLCFGEGKEKNP